MKLLNLLTPMACVSDYIKSWTNSGVEQIKMNRIDTIACLFIIFLRKILFIYSEAECASSLKLESRTRYKIPVSIQ